MTWLARRAPKQADPPETLTAVREATHALTAAQGRLTAAVRAARGDGRSWADIGAAAGTSRQSAHERWGPESPHDPSPGPASPTSTA